MKKPKQLLKDVDFANMLKNVNFSTYLKYKGLDLFGAIKTHKKKFLFGSLALVGLYNKN